MGEIFFDVSLEWILLVISNFAFIVILLVISFSNRQKIKKLKDKYDRFMTGLDGDNIEELLEEYIGRVEKVDIKNRDLENNLNTLERNLLQCVQKVGIVRFNAFDNVGSDLSFSIALLDGNDDGIVISGLYSRDNSVTYGKPISGNKSRYPLSAEEMKAIDIAKKRLIG